MASRFRVGDRVAVMRDDRPVDRSTVVRVSARFVEISNGLRYQPDGWDYYPMTGRSFDVPRIEPMTSDLKAQLHASTVQDRK